VKDGKEGGGTALYWRLFQFPSLDGRGQGRVKREQVCHLHPHLASPIKGEEGGGRKISLKLIPMGINL